MFGFDDLPGVKTFVNIFRIVTLYFWQVDRQIMQDIEWEHRCMLFSVFLTLFRVCALCVILVAIMFALDEVDTEGAVMALIHFMKKF